MYKYFQFPDLFDSFSDFDRIINKIPTAFDYTTNRQSHVEESDEAYTLLLALPGYKKSDFDITTENRVLSISYESPEKEDSPFKKSFKRSYKLPPGCDVDGITANFKDGILTVGIPKEEVAKAKSVEIK